MSDEDAPTRRLPVPGDDAPTERLPAAEAEPGIGNEPAAETELAGERRRSRSLLATLIAVGAALLIALIVLLVILFAPTGDAGPTPTPSSSESGIPTPSATPSDSPTPTPEPSEPAPEPEPEPEPEPTEEPEPPSAIVSFTASTTQVDCTGAESVDVTFSWNTTGDSVTFGVGNDDATAEPYETGLPPIEDGYDAVQYQCGQPGGQQKYAIAVIDDGRVVARQTIVISE